MISPKTPQISFNRPVLLSRRKFKAYKKKKKLDLYLKSSDTFVFWEKKVHVDLKQVLGFPEDKSALGLRNGEADPFSEKEGECGTHKEAHVQFPVASGVTPTVTLGRHLSPPRPVPAPTTSDRRWLV